MNLSVKTEVNLASAVLHTSAQLCYATLFLLTNLPALTYKLSCTITNIQI
ncbi:hypothetical protein NTGHW29_900009 [Candidatus Nitrotoga sp. HW29]|nr:hypothetical protein NTGHW29_900009 [Candidatus Nitrotoga sp. HW29]